MVARLSLFALISRVRARADPATSVSRATRDRTDPLAPLAAVWLLTAGATSFSRNCCWQIPVRGDDGVRAIGANEMMLLRPAAAQRGSATGSSTTGGTERSAEWWLG